MNKAEIIAGTAHRMGARIEDLFEAAKRESLKHTAQREAYQKSAKAVEQLLNHVSKDLDEGKLEMEQAKLVKTWLGRAISVCENMGRNSENLILVSQGQVKGLETALGTAKQEYDVASAKAAKNSEPEAAEEAEHPQDDRHPGASIKDERQAE